jgi:hypothetical protein
MARSFWPVSVFLVAVLVGPAACGGHTHPWRTPVAAGILAATVTQGVVEAVQRKAGPGPDQPGLCPRAPAPPEAPGCVLKGPRRHDAAERCTYFCVDHCSYHLGGAQR